MLRVNANGVVEPNLNFSYEKAEEERKYYPSSIYPNTNIMVGNEPEQLEFKRQKKAEAFIREAGTNHIVEQLSKKPYAFLQNTENLGTNAIGYTTSSTQGMNAGVNGAGAFVWDTSDAELERLRQQRKKKFVDSYNRWFEGDTTPKPVNLYEVFDSLEKQQYKQLFESIQSRLIEDVYDTSIFRDLFAFTQFYVRFTPYMTEQQFIEYINKFNDLQTIILNFQQLEQVKNKDESKYIGVLLANIDGLIKYTEENIKFVGRSLEERKIIAKDTTNLLNVDKQERILQKIKVGPILIKEAEEEAKKTASSMEDELNRDISMMNVPYTMVEGEKEEGEEGEEEEGEEDKFVDVRETTELQPAAPAPGKPKIPRLAEILDFFKKEFNFKTGSRQNQIEKSASFNGEASELLGAPFNSELDTPSKRKGYFKGRLLSKYSNYDTSDLDQIRNAPFK